MEVVNAVYKARLKKHKLDLHHLSSLIPNSVLRIGRPTQLSVEINKVKIFLFCGRGVRVMGKGDLLTTDCLSNELMAYGHMLAVLEHFTEEMPALELQTMTVTAQVENWQKTNFTRFIQECGFKTYHDFEIFSALRITQFNPVCVNLFSSGKLVMCGVKSIEQAEEIQLTINTCYNTIE